MEEYLVVIEELETYLLGPADGAGIANYVAKNARDVDTGNIVRIKGNSLDKAREETVQLVVRGVQVSSTIGRIRTRFWSYKIVRIPAKRGYSKRTHRRRKRERTTFAP